MPLGRSLPNKPLIEAILEFSWQVAEIEGDPNYTLLVGRLYDRVQNQYPFHESLPTTIIPVQIAANLPQHRFRSSKGHWPLIQLGPGIVTLNDTEGYEWQSFGQRAKSLVRAVFDAYPEPQQLKVSSIVLRYLDAFDLEPDEDLLGYMYGKLKTTFTLPMQLFEGTGVSPSPKAINVSFSFPTPLSKGEISVKFSSGRHNNKRALIMEIGVRCGPAEIPKMPEGFDQWVEDAHTLSENWFFKFIEGDLLKRFSGE